MAGDQLKLENRSWENINSETVAERHLDFELVNKARICVILN